MDTDRISMLRAKFDEDPESLSEVEWEELIHADMDAPLKLAKSDPWQAANRASVKVLGGLAKAVGTFLFAVKPGRR